MKLKGERSVQWTLPGESLLVVVVRTRDKMRHISTDLSFSAPCLAAK